MKHKKVTIPSSVYIAYRSIASSYGDMDLAHRFLEAVMDYAFLDIEPGETDYPLGEIFDLVSDEITQE